MKTLDTHDSLSIDLLEDKNLNDY